MMFDQLMSHYLRKTGKETYPELFAKTHQLKQKEAAIVYFISITKLLGLK